MLYLRLRLSVGKKYLRNSDENTKRRTENNYCMARFGSASGSTRVGEIQPSIKVMKNSQTAGKETGAAFGNHTVKSSRSSGH